MTLRQINNLEMELTVLSSVPLEEQELMLQTNWLTPVKFYKKGEAFGEKSLNLTRPDFRAGKAVCT